MRGVVAAVFQGARPCPGRSVTKRAPWISSWAFVRVWVRVAAATTTNGLWFVP